MVKMTKTSSIIVITYAGEREGRDGEGGSQGQQYP